MLKYTYLKSTQKQKVRDFFLAKFKFENVIGLAGPDINEYIDRLESEGCKEFEIYENDAQTYSSQLAIVKKPVSIVLGDILEADADRENTLYDLDFCRTVTSLTPHIKKFQNNFMMTFSQRIKGGAKSSIRVFFDSRDELLYYTRDIDAPIKHTELVTNKGQYLFTEYYDTTPMCCFAKIN